MNIAGRTYAEDIKGQFVRNTGENERKRLHRFHRQMTGATRISVGFCWLCYGTPRKVVVLADSSCDYCKGYIFVLVPGYVVGDFYIYYKEYKYK